jgi:PiT family inorganic phosphate transporter
LSAVRWGVARQIAWAWLLTIPASAVLGSLFYKLISSSGIK